MQYTAHAFCVYEKVSNPSSETQPVYRLVTALPTTIDASRVADLLNDAYYDGERNAYTKVVGYVARQEKK